MRTNIDFTPYRHATVGFDRLFDLLESGFPSQLGENYPPFDLVQEGEDRYRITLAVAGFRADEIDVTAQQNLLIVTGRKKDEDGRRYIHRGIAARAFERRFALGDYVQVRGAELRDGMLSIELEREIPEAMRPRKIEIGGGQSAGRLEAAPAGQESGSGKVRELEAA
ncbi:Hsp20 family protein [Sphingosinicella sp. CPCC 101087]|uniref:Hsp20 family protein n=1 Tax=Sphingosinicella sp. CPCC 101087 TaxID=2497754 RepID=UPI00101C248E|nr:Hsp20 family protein [Sphingosinicella sp. CPCC 101087]